MAALLDAFGSLAEPDARGVVVYSCSLPFGKILSHESSHT